MGRGSNVKRRYGRGAFWVHVSGDVDMSCMGGQWVGDECRDGDRGN